jgi:hypothetical protein
LISLGESLNNNYIPLKLQGDNFTDVEENDANYENLGTETEMRELVITLMKKGRKA